MKRTYLALFLALFLTAPLVAQDAVATRFFVERIEVRDARRVSTDVIIAESRLREGSEYSEADLRDAAARLQRLPFLLSAEFSLEKGSERGRHVLVITVAETKPFFFALDARPIIASDGGYVSTDPADTIGAQENRGTVGFRWFVGRRGQLHAGLYSRTDNHEITNDYGALAVGYTQHDLFGTRAFATINLKLVSTVEGGQKITPQVVVGVPLTGNQTLTLEYDQTDFGRRNVNSETWPDIRSTEELLSARWSYNTTNHPFLPTDGTLLGVRLLAVSRERVDSIFIVRNPTTPPLYDVIAVAVEEESLGFGVDASRYWELSERNSVMGGVEAGYAQVDRQVSHVTGPQNLNLDPTHVVLRTAFSHSFWDREARKRGDSRAEVTLSAARRERLRDLSRTRVDDDIQLTTSWVRRSSWGTLRLGVGYSW